MGQGEHFMKPEHKAFIKIMVLKFLFLMSVVVGAFTLAGMVKM